MLNSNMRSEIYLTSMFHCRAAQDDDGILHSRIFIGLEDPLQGVDLSTIASARICGDGMRVHGLWLLASRSLPSHS